MVFKDEVYKFQIWYIGEGKTKQKKIMYSDKADIFELKDLPKTTYYISSEYINLKEHQFWGSAVEQYNIGDEITLEEAKKEIEALEKLNIDECSVNEKCHKLEILYSLKAFCEDEENNTKKADADKIYLNRNIDLDCGAAIRARVRVVPASSNCQIISPSQIIKGKIFPIEQVHDVEKYGENPYIGLE